ncbi:MAG: hypothetical protein ACXWQO_18460, partial [Bdellovibrionota bacterium]
KYEVDHSYIASDDVPTVFYKQPFETQYLDDGKHNFFLEMDRQLDERNSIPSRPKKLYLMDAYTLHRADAAKKDTNRTIVRVLFSKHKYDRLGETENPLIPAWPREKRGIDTTLTLPEQTAENFLGQGFAPELAGVTPDSLRTNSAAKEYISKQLGSVATSSMDTVIVKGTTSEALKKLKDSGWTVTKEVSQSEGNYRIFEATHQSGAKANAIVGISSAAGLTHVQRMLKLSGKDPAKVFTLGSYR